MKVMATFWLIFFLGLVRGSYQVCETWTSINETIYSQTYVTITDPTANTVRPLGFKTAVYRFEGERPCKTVAPTDGNMRHIEVKWELEQAGRLCVTNNANNQNRCGTSRQFSLCTVVPGSQSSIEYRFFCEGDGCESGDKLFWYRFVVESPMENGMYNENWCDTRDDRYPGSLVRLPTNFIPPTQATTPRNKASSVASNVLVMMATLLIAAALH